ncbi:MAG: hypothetical protein QOI21_4157 [Actinomycetota bacterium]|nr:hypothetical protein [Actinomycetota bacterium]
MIAFGVLAARIVIGLVLVVSLTQKTLRPKDFTRWLTRLDVVPGSWAGVVATAMAGVEAVAVVLLALPGTYRAGLGLAAVVTAFFAASIFWLARRGTTEPCHCFGASSTRPMGRTEIVRNLVLTAVAGVAAVAGPQPSLAFGDGLLAVSLGGALAVLTVRLDDLVWLFAPLKESER